MRALCAVVALDCLLRRICGLEYPIETTGSHDGSSVKVRFNGYQRKG